METHRIQAQPGKKFRHYFFEFIMLFLAVFCGFLAENWREEITESKRERQYISSMIEDLKQDTAMLNKAFNINQQENIITDSLLDILEKKTYDKNDIAKMYYMSI